MEKKMEKKTNKTKSIILYYSDFYATYEDINDGINSNAILCGQFVKDRINDTPAKIKVTIALNENGEIKTKWSDRHDRMVWFYSSGIIKGMFPLASEILKEFGGDSFRFDIHIEPINK